MKKKDFMIIKTKLKALLALLVLIFPILAFAQQGASVATQPEYSKYKESTLDMEVKVAGGSIKVIRTWDGAKWILNPQHADIEIPVSASGSGGGRARANRGLRQMLDQGSDAYTVAQSFRFGASAGVSDGTFNISSSLQNRLNQGGVNSCRESTDQSEVLLKTGYGYRWVNKSNRHWAEYEDNQFKRWGVGKRKIGEVLHDAEGLVRGYADKNGVEVITYIRDALNRVQYVRDYTGRQVEYKYESPNTALITEVVDLNSNPTRYQYNLYDRIETKTIGNNSGATADEAISEQVTYTLSYKIDGEFISIRDDNDHGSDFTYDYRPQEKLVIKTETQTDGKEIVTKTHLEAGIKSIEVDGVQEFRVFHFCEDSLTLDRHNRETYYDRDKLGRLKGVFFASGAAVKSTYIHDDWPRFNEQHGALVDPWGADTYTTPNGTVINYVRNDFGEIREAVETSPQGAINKWRFLYDTDGNRIEQRKLTDPNQHDNTSDWISSWTYDDKGRIATQTNAIGQTWAYEYNARGDATKITAPNNAVWNFAYTAEGDLKYRKTPSGLESFFTYNKRGLLKEYREIYNTGKEAILKFLYNSRGQVTKIIDPLAGLWQYQYDASGFVKLAIDPAGKTRSWTYRSDGRVKSVTDGNGQTITLDYFDTSLSKENPQAITPFGPIVHINYPTYTEELNFDLGDRLAARKITPKNDPGSPARTTFYNYDIAGRLLKIIYPDSKETLYTYDQQNRVTSVTHPGWGVSTINYSQDDRTVTYKDPLGNEITQEFNQIGQLTSETRADGTAYSLTYDLLGNVESFLNSNNQLHWFEYDLAGRQTRSEIYPGGVKTATPASATDYTYNFRGDLLSYSDGNTSTNYTLDPLGRLLTASTNFGPFSKTHSYTYLSNGLRNTYTAASGETYKYLWDSNNQFKGITISNEGSITYAYSPQDSILPASITFPGGAKQNFEYDGFTRLKRITSEDPATNPVLDRQYSFLDGAVISSIETEDGPFNYEYDDAFRLTSVASPVLSDESYSYDEFGNRYGTLNPENYAYDKNGAVLSADGISFEYDPQGNRTKRTDASGVTHYFYNESDRLTRVEKPLGTVISQYSYDPQGYRNWKDIGGTKTYFYHTEEGLAAEFDSSGNTIRSYIYEPESYWGTAPLAMRASGSYHYFHTDHLGTPQKLTAKSGATTWSANYTGFGAATVNNSTVTNPIRLPGQYYDSETGLHQNFMRDYDPEIGAYLEQDPYGILTGPNRYGYVYGDPVGLSDPTGEIVPILIAGGAKILFVGGGILAGIEAYDCAQYLWDSCLNADGAASCKNAVIGFGLGLVGGAVFNAGVQGVRRFGGAFRRFGRLGDFFRRFGDELSRFRGFLNKRRPPNRVYSARELIRRSREPGPFHNFPESFNQNIFQGRRDIISDNFTLYSHPGRINNVEGVFEIGVRPSPSGRTEVIVHRFFRPNRR